MPDLQRKPEDYLRDLNWAISSPSLITAPVTDESIDATAVSTAHLANFMESSDHRVGRYFERLVLYWLQHIRREQILAESLPIREGNRTIGEIDLLFRDQHQRTQHWELAVKFYLHFPQSESFDSHYIGPNAGDTFERKMERLFSHQLPLGERFYPDAHVRRAFVKGRIFYHPDQDSPVDLPELLSPKHLRGVWIRSSQLDWIEPGSTARYRILRKPNWLSDDSGGIAEDDLITLPELKDQVGKQFTERDQPILISRLETTENLMKETERIFIVADTWPQGNAIPSSSPSRTPPQRGSRH